MGVPRNQQYRMAVLLLVAIVITSIGNLQRLWDLRVPIGPLYSTHWLGIFGAGFIGIFAPLYAYFKRHNIGSKKNLLTTHVFGNLIAFLLISIHFTQQEGRPPEFQRVHLTGFILFTVVAILVVTGFLQRFQINNKMTKSWRFTHVSLSLTFYTVLISHILQLFNIL